MATTTTATSTLKRNAELIRQVLESQDFDAVCRSCVVIANQQLGAGACSLFLFNPENNELLLKESTVLTPQFQACLVYEPTPKGGLLDKLINNSHSAKRLQHALTWKEARKFGDEFVRAVLHYGLTRWSLEFDQPLLIDRVPSDIRHSQFDLSRVPDMEREAVLGPNYQEPKRDPDVAACELHDIGSAMYVPMVCPPPRKRGLLRLVRNVGETAFSVNDLEALFVLRKIVSERMASAMPLADILDLGAKQDVEQLAQTLVELLRKRVHAKGCSIFLNTQTEGSVRSFKCIATTGLGQKTSSGEYRELKNFKDACYEIDESDPNSTSLTEWVVKKRQMAITEDLYKLDAGAFQGLRRGPGPGRYSELLYQNGQVDSRRKTGPSVVVPFLLHGGSKVAGVIRVVGLKTEPFKQHEQLLLFDIAQRLSKVLSQVRFREASEKLFVLHHHPDAIMNKLPKEICMLLGVEGCSVFLAKDKLLVFAGTVGLLENEQVEPYQIHRNEVGWTAWVATRRRPLLFNSPDQRDANYADDPPRHRADDSACEVRGGPYRFIAVPVLSPKEAGGKQKLLGVIRAPRSRREPEFVPEDLAVLDAFADRLALALENARRLAAVAELNQVPSAPDPFGAPRDPARVQAERAVQTLIGPVGFEFAAVHGVNPDTSMITMMFGCSNEEDTDPNKWFDAEHTIHSNDIHAYVLRLGRGVVVKADKLVDELAPPKDLLDRSVYDACDHTNLIRYFHPILLGEARFGTIEVGYNLVRGPDEIADYQKRLVQLVAGSCAAAFHAGHLIKTLRDINHALVEIGRTMREPTGVHAKLTAIAGHAAKLTRADSVVIFEYVAHDRSNLETGTFKDAAIGGVEPTVWREKVRTSSILYAIIQLDKGEFVDEASNKETSIVYNKNSPNPPNFVEREQIASSAAFPLIIDGERVGCALFNFKRRQRFNDNAAHRHQIQMMAEYAAAIIYQNRLMAEKSYLLKFADHSLSAPLQALSAFLFNLTGKRRFSELKVSTGGTMQHYLESAFAKVARRQYQVARYMAYLVKSFLDVNADQDVQAPELKLGQHDLVAVCSEAVEIAQAWASTSSEREVKGELSGSILVELDANATQLALLNILINGVQYSKTRVTLILQRLSTGGVMISIEDDGDGIGEDFRELVLQRGFRIPSSKPKPLGLGLGLYLSKNHLERQGFSLRVGDRSRNRVPLPGAVFEITIPATKVRS